MTHKNDFLRKGPAGLVVVPLLFALVTLALLAVMFKVFAAPYYSAGRVVYGNQRGGNPAQGPV